MAWVVADRKGHHAEREEIVVLSEEALNDSDKTFTMGTDISGANYAKIMRIRLEYTCSADAGNRLISIRLKDSAGDILHELKVVEAVVASDVMVWEIAPGWTALITAVDATTDGKMQMPPDLMILTGQSLQIVDTAAIAAAADDMTIHLTLAMGEVL